VDILELGLPKQAGFYTFAGFLNAYTLNYRLMKNGYCGQTNWVLRKSDNLEVYCEFYHNADFVVAGEFGTGFMYSWLPAARWRIAL
jgi:hypothetical protein